MCFLFDIKIPFIALTDIIVRASSIIVLNEASVILVSFEFNNLAKLLFAIEKTVSMLLNYTKIMSIKGKKGIEELT